MMDLANLSSSDLSQLDIPSKLKGGVLVRSVENDMPASKYLRRLDIITKIDDTTIESTADLQSALYSHQSMIRSRSHSIVMENNKQLLSS